MSNNFKSFFASIGLLFITIIWGFAFVVVKNSLDYIGPIYMMAFRFSIASVVLSIIFINKFKLLTKKMFLHGIGLGLFLALAYAFQTIGCKYTTAGKNAFLTTIYVILVPFLNWIIVKRKPDIYSVIAAFLSILGIGLLSLKGDLSINIGDLLTLICGICYALHIVYIAKYSQNDDPIVLTILQLTTTAILSWIFAPIFDGAFPLSGLKQSGVIPSMLYLGLLSTMAAFLLQNICQKYTKPAMAALLMSFESVFGLVFSIIFLHETLTTKALIGCVLMFIAILVSELKPGKKIKS